MRSSITLLSLLVATGAAIADATPVQRTPAQPASNAPAPAKTPATNLAPLDLTTMPEQCRTIAKQAGSATLSVALSARISLANCLADVKVAPLVLCDCEDSMLAIDDAMKQSFELLDEVVVAGDDVTKIVGERAKAEHYASMTARMLKTLPPPGGTESSIALHNARKAILDGLLGRWRNAAATSYERILTMVKGNPKLEKNPVVAAAVRTAKDRLRLHVAVATPAPQPAQPAQGEGSKNEDRDAVIKDVDDSGAPAEQGETLR